MDKILLIGEGKDFDQYEKFFKDNSIKIPFKHSFFRENTNHYEFELIKASNAEEGKDKIILFIEEEEPIKLVVIDKVEIIMDEILSIDKNLNLIIISDIKYDDIKDFENINRVLFFNELSSEQFFQLSVNLTSFYYNRLVREKFLSKVAHDIMTPIAGLSGFYSLLCDVDELSDDSREYLDIMGDSIKLTENFVRDFNLTFDENVNKYYFNEEELELSKFLEGCISQAKKVFNKKDRVKIRLGNVDNCKISADKYRLFQCINELIENAYKNTDNGHIEIGVKNNNNCIEIYVEDTGIGVSDDNLSKLFDLGFKIERQEGKKTGLGFGLWIIDKIIKGHDGEVHFKSTLGKGSFVSIKLPA